MIALTLLAPMASFAQGPDKGHRGNERANEVHMKQLEKRVAKSKHRLDVQISLLGKVTAMSSSTITLQANNGSSYSIDASQARLTRHFGAQMGMGDIQVNDQLFVVGTFNGTTVMAKTVQNLSLQSRKGEFTGTVKSVSTSSFVLTSNNRGDQTINISTTTKIMKGDQLATLTDLTVGAQVHVDGVWDRTNSNVTANKVKMVVVKTDVRLNGTVSALNNVSATGTTSSSLTLAATDGKSYQVGLRDASLITRNYSGNDFSRVHVGDTVQVQGKSETASTTVQARLVVDFSL